MFPMPWSCWLRASPISEVALARLNKHAYYTNLSANDDFSLIRGAHQFSFGASEMRALVSSLSNAYSPGVYTFNGQNDLFWAGGFFRRGSGVDTPGGSNDLYTHQWFFGAYAQDTWKVTHRLTLNYGVRWEPFFPMQNNAKQVYTFSPARLYAGTVSSVYTNAPPGSIIRAILVSVATPASMRAGPISSPALVWLSIPVAMERHPFVREWDLPTIFSLTTYQNMVSSAPFGGTLRSTDRSPCQSLEHHARRQPFPYSSVRPSGSSGQRRHVLFSANFKTTGVYNWNVALERQFTQRCSLPRAIWETCDPFVRPVELNPGVYVPGCEPGQYGLKATSWRLDYGKLIARRVLNMANPARRRLAT